MIENIVLDTNLLISAALFKNSVPRKAFNKAKIEYNIITSNKCLAELEEVIFRPKFKKYIDNYEANEFLLTYKQIAEIVIINVNVFDCRDPKDNKFLDLALSGNGKIIVSGDDDLLIMNPYNSIKIIKASDFLSLY